MTPDVSTDPSYEPVPLSFLIGRFSVWLGRTLLLRHASDISDLVIQKLVEQVSIVSRLEFLRGMFTWLL